jgi:hypothetical protein
MPRNLSKDNQKGVGIYLTKPVYEAWLDYLTIKDLTLALSPAMQEEFFTVRAGSRSDFIVKTIKMPVWWVDWYRSLSVDDRFRFARIVEKRLRQLGLVGGII